MRFYEASSTIRATPEAIWDILTDAPSYSSWNNGVVRVEGRILPRRDDQGRVGSQPGPHVSGQGVGLAARRVDGVVGRHAARLVPRRSHVLTDTRRRGDHQLQGSRGVHR